MTTEFNTLKTFDYQNSEVQLWVFKDSASQRRFRAVYVQTDEELSTQLKNIVAKNVSHLTEHEEYSYISQNNENSCLTIDKSETDFSVLQTLVDRVAAENRATDKKDLLNAKGYVVKFTGSSETVYAVKRSTSTWKTGYSKKFVNMVFRNGELSGMEDTSFSIEKNFDFYIVEDLAFITNKRGFESAMGHSESYKQAFSQLQSSPEFSALFTDLSPIIEYVGTNSIQLRRMAVIEQKSVYSQPGFLPTLKAVSDSRNWGLNFDESTNNIIPCEDTVKTIIQVLLDHRLLSELTSNTYDVPDAKPV